MQKSNLAVVLEVEKKGTGELSRNGNEMFYRYAIGDFKLWFSQDMDSGNIYSVGLREDGSELADFELRVYANEEGRGGYFPNDFVIRPRSQPMSTDDARAFMRKFEKACMVLDAVEAFFESSKHYALYAKCHRIGEKSIKVEAFKDTGGAALYSQVYPVRSQADALTIFKAQHPEYKGCILVAEDVYDIDAPTEIKKEDEMISREAVMGDILAYFGRNNRTWDSLSEDCKRAWNVIEGYASSDGDLVSREGLLDAVLDQFGCDLAYLGADLQFMQEAIQCIPAASDNLVVELISDAKSRSGARNADTPSKGNDDLMRE